MTLQPATLPWFARYELLLAWRDIRYMLTAGRPTRRFGRWFFAILGISIIHLVAWGIIKPWVDSHPAGIVVYLRLTVFGLLFGSMMISQALEAVTRSYYARSDLEMILASPAPAPRLFAVRAAGIALVNCLMACFMASPLINCLVLADGAHWLAGYVVVASFSAVAAASGILITLGLFRFVGAKRTRVIAQIIAAVVSSAFIIGIQVVAILHYNSLSRFSVLDSAEVLAAVPGAASWAWLPARAAMGETIPMLATTLFGLTALVVAIRLGSVSFSRYAISTAGLARQSRAEIHLSRLFRPQSAKQALRTKEWRLLRRDPWLLSQILMQILYLIPPALLLWMNYGDRTGVYIVVVPVLVMASGQLAGGLAWLAISGEDAPELVSSAPVRPGVVLMAKIEAVLAIVTVLIAPLLALMAVASPEMAGITFLCAACAAASSTAIQLWFRVVARRSMFRRRQVASRASTLCEALTSISWAGMAAVWASAETWEHEFAWMLPLSFAVMALFVLAIAWLIAPKR
jgi:ABC-2 type transport system permease protein